MGSRDAHPQVRGSGGGRRAFQEAGGAGAKALEQELAMSEPGSGGGR